MSATDDMLESIAEMIEYAREKAAYGKTYSPVHKVALEIRELQQLLRFRGRSIKYHSFGDAILSSPLHEMEAQLSPRERQIASLLREQTNGVQKQNKDWRRTIGMFTDNPGMQELFAEAQKLRGMPHVVGAAPAILGKAMITGSR